MKKIVARIATVLGSATAVVAVAVTPSFAAVDPSVSTAVQGGFTDMTGMIVTTLLPALFGLVILGIAVRLGIKYLKRGTSA